MKLTDGTDRSQFHDKAWALYQSKALDDAKLPKLSVYAIRTLWNALYDSMPIAAPTQGADARPAAWDNLPCYLIDKCEGQVISEEFLQRALSGMLADPQYSAAKPFELSQEFISESKDGPDVIGFCADARPVASDAHKFALMCDALPADFNWGDPLTPDVFRHIESALATHDAALSDSQDDARKAILEEAALTCRARITGTRRTADIEAAECMNAIRAMYLAPEPPKKSEDWS